MSYLRRMAAVCGTPPQSEPLNERSTKNNAGGYGFDVSAIERLERFLILGSEGGTYYVSENDLTKQNIDNLKNLVATQGIAVVQKIREISTDGRAPKNDPALFALAYCAAKGDLNTRTLALQALPEVARTSTHLFMFVGFVRKFRGWGRGLRRAIANWYTAKTPDQLASQVTKYQSREGWSHRDLMRLRHVRFTGAHQQIAKWVVKDEIGPDTPTRILGHVALQKAQNADEAATLITVYNLTRESVPTQFMKSPEVWEALLQNAPMTMLIRNLGNLSKCGLLAPFSDTEKKVVAMLSDADVLRKARIHPIAVLLAAKVYGQGHGVRGNSEWKVCPKVVSALDAAFVTAFKNVEPTGKNHYLGIDVSGSMAMGEVAGAPGLTPACGAAAMALVTARTEPNTYMQAFSDGLTPITITEKETLESMTRKISNWNFGGTDCSLPIQDALDRNLKVDAFVIYTDGETWAGDAHAAQLLDRYRQKTGINAKLVVCGMVSTPITIADPKDAGSMNVVGFDSAAPQIMANFIR